MPTGNDPLRYIVNHSGRSECMVMATDFDRVTAENQALRQRLTTADQRIDDATSLIRRMVANFDADIRFYKDVEPNDLEHDEVLADMRRFLELADYWRRNPCKQGHGNVGAACGVAHCYTCDERITAATTQEALEQWNTTHPAVRP